MTTKKKLPMSAAKKAALIGVVCILTYAINYYLRNMLSVFTPTLLASGLYTESHIGLLSSTYMIFYAGGQLINGFLGDMLSPKKMIFGGIFVAGLATAAFPFLPNALLQILCFALLGFALSMTRGPLMKIISENTEPRHARTICVFFSFASFAGPLIASLFAILFATNLAFVLAGALAAAVIPLSIVTLFLMEKKQYIAYKPQAIKKFPSITEVFKIEKFFFYLVIACLVEISGAAISFWIPTYLNSHLGFDATTSNLIFSLISIFRAFMPFLSLMIFNAIGERDVLMMRTSFILVTALFLSLLFVHNPWANIVLLILALMGMSCVAALLWSIYIPGLGKTGRVSSVNGILDCSGYIAAALANLLFANFIKNVGWNGVLLVWAGIGAVGIIATLFVKNKKKKSENQ